MKPANLILICIFLGLLSCTNSTEKHEKKAIKYNPIIAKTLYYPERSQIIEYDTLANGDTITADIIPIKNCFNGLDKEYHDTSVSNVVVRTLYQDYFIRIRISSIKEYMHIDRDIYKNEFKSILKPETTHYYFRNVKFVEFVNDEYRFNIKLSFADSKKADGMIKFFISKNNKTRFEDFPKSFYDHEFPSPD